MLLVGMQEGHPACKKHGEDGGGGHWLVWMEWRMVGVSASVNLPLHYKVQKISSGTGIPGWSRKRGRKMVVVVSESHAAPCPTHSLVRIYRTGIVVADSLSCCNQA